MSNILIQYDWNNHKEVSQKKLTELFVNLTLSDKITVYRILSNRRKLLLRKGYDKWKTIQDKEDFKEFKESILEPLKGMVDTEDIKTDLELMMTIGILLTGSKTMYFDCVTSNLSKEKESFELTKEKMIGWIGSICMRNNPNATCNEDIENTIEAQIMNELEKLEYVTPMTLAQYRNIQTKQWEKCYCSIGVGKERANRLATTIEKKIKQHYLDREDKGVIKRELFEDGLPYEYKVSALALIGKYL